MSIKLPHQLSPWEPQLRIFPEEIAVALGPLVQKVASVIGSYPHPHAEGNAVPDGFAGIAKRGAYDRLVASNWLLADEFPEEFMRRSVMGEHLFWKLAYREPALSHSTLVLFDEGPEQLGAPRILHLAALAVFEARARRANARFNWGILQCPEQGPLPGFNVAEITGLLNARGSVSATSEHLAAWSQRVSAIDQPGEVWVVGSQRLRSVLPPDVCSFLITDLMEPGERKLEAECRPAGQHARSIELELPASTVCVQLLRDPFSIAVAPSRQAPAGSAVSKIVLSPAGNKLWAKTERGIMAFSVPNSPRDPGGSLKDYETLSRFPQVAVGRVGRSTALVSMNPISLALSVRRLGRMSSDDVGNGEYEFLDSPTRPLFQYGGLSLCVGHPVANQKPGLYMLDEGGSLLRLFVDSEGKRRCEVAHDYALALTRCRMGLCYAAYETDGNGSVQVFVGGHVPAQRWPSPMIPQQVFFGHGPSFESPVYGQIAFGYSRTHWEIHNAGGRTELSVPQDFTVYGVIQDRNYEPTLIVVEDDMCTLSLHGAHGTRKLFKASGPIVTVSGCHALPLIAWATSSGEISVFSLRHQALVLSLMRKAT